MKRLLRPLCFLLCVVLLAGCTGSLSGLDQSAASFRSLLGVRGKILSHQDVCPAGNSSFDWMAMALKLSGAQDDYDGYLAAMAQSVTDRYEENGALDAYKPTEYHRIALTVLALGGDPTAFGTDSQGNSVNLIADGTYSYDGDLGVQGLNSLIFALITLYAGAYEVPGPPTVGRRSSPPFWPSRSRTVASGFCPAVRIRTLPPWPCRPWLPMTRPRRPSSPPCPICRVK